LSIFNFLKCSNIDSINNYWNLIKNNISFNKEKEALNYFERNYIKIDEDLIWYNTEKIPDIIPITNNAPELFNSVIKSQFTNRLKHNLNMFLDTIVKIIDRYVKKKL